MEDNRIGGGEGLGETTTTHPKIEYKKIATFSNTLVGMLICNPELDHPEYCCKRYIVIYKKRYKEQGKWDGTIVIEETVLSDNASRVVLSKKEFDDLKFRIIRVDGKSKGYVLLKQMESEYVSDEDFELELRNIKTLIELELGGLK